MIKKVPLNTREGFKLLMNHTPYNKPVIEAVKDLCYVFTYTYELDYIYLMDDIYGDVATYNVVSDFPQWAQDSARKTYEQFNEWTREECGYYEQFDA